MGVGVSKQAVEKLRKESQPGVEASLDSRVGGGGDPTPPRNSVTPVGVLQFSSVLTPIYSETVSELTGEGSDP